MNYLDFWGFAILFQLILNDFGNILALAEVCSNDKVSLAKALLNLFRHERQVKVLLKSINDYYITKEGKDGFENLIFSILR